MWYMSYADIDHLKKRYPEHVLRNLTDPDAQVINESCAQQALDDATAEMDAWLERRFAMPLVDKDNGVLIMPSVLERCACDIAVYRLQTLRPADDIKDARQRYEDVIKLLKSMATGDVSIPGARLRADVADTTKTQSTGLPEFGQPESLFGRGNR